MSNNNRRTVRVGLYTEGGVLHDVFSYYRVMGPWPAARKFAAKHDPDIELELNRVQTVQWNSMRNLDVMFMHRPYSPQDLEALRIAKDNGVKVWVDVDDDYFNLLPSFRHYPLYQKPEIIASMKAIAQEADMRTVSTQALAESLTAKTGASFNVLPNGFPLNLNLLKSQSEAPPHSYCFTWRGTEEATRDLLQQASVIANFMIEHNIGIHTFGIYPWPLLDAGVPASMIKCEGLIGFEAFFQRMREIRPLFHLKVHEDVPFHNARSHCAWFEATQANTLLVAPNFKEWERPNVIRYEQDDLMGAMEAALSQSTFDRDFHLSHARVKIKNEYNQDDGPLVKKRLELLKKCLR